MTQAGNMSSLSCTLFTQRIRAYKTNTMTPIKNIIQLQMSITLAPMLVRIGHTAATVAAAGHAVLDELVVAAQDTNNVSTLSLHRQDRVRDDQQ